MQRPIAPGSFTIGLRVGVSRFIVGFFVGNSGFIVGFFVGNSRFTVGLGQRRHETCTGLIFEFLVGSALVRAKTIKII
jgi:hypothetical protein